MTRIINRFAKLAAVGAFVAAALLETSPAEAGRVVVLAVQGDPDGELEDGLVSMIEDTHDLLTSGEFERAARKSGIDDLDGPAIGKLARKLGADAVVEGSVSREDEGFLLVVRIRGADGKTVKKISVDLAKPRLSAKAKKRIATGVLDGIDKVLGIASEERISDDDDDDDDGESRKSKKKAKKKAKKAVREVAMEDEDDDRRGRKDDEDDEDDGEDEDADDDQDEDADRDDDDDRVAARDDDDDDIDDELGIGRDRDDGERKKVRDPRRPAVHIEVGPSAIARTLAFTSRAEFPEAPQGYKTTLVPGFRAAGEAYPLAFGDPTTAAAGLGMAFEFDQTLSAKARTSEAREVAMKVTQKHWVVGLRYRYAFGDKPTMPSVTIGVGYGRRVYQIDRSGLPAEAELDVPDVDYRYIDPGLTVRIPLGRRAALSATGKALLFRKAGDIQSTSSYGGSKLTGFEAGAGLEVPVAKNILVSLAGSMTQIGYAFVGNGEESNNRDLNPDTKDVGGAADRYLGVVGTVGYSY